MENPLAVLLHVTSAFSTLGINYVVVGSIASSIHGVYRASGDIDLVADLNYEHVDGLAKALRDDFYLDELAIRRAVANGRSFNVIHLHSIFKVDVFVAATDLAKQHLARRELYSLAPELSQAIWLATAEDTIVAKLHWYRTGGEVSELQWRDVKGILGTRAGLLDQQYLRRWAERAGVIDLLERIQREVE